MNNSKKEFKQTLYKGAGKIYFKSIIDEIIKIGLLSKERKILDFGCGVKFLEKRLNKKILNYDIYPEFSEIGDIFEHDFDVMVINHVLMYLSPKDIRGLFDKLLLHRKNCKFIIGISRVSLLNKLLAIFALEFNAHKNTKTSPILQKEIILEYCDLISHKSVFFMTDIFYLKFKNKDK